MPDLRRVALAAVGIGLLAAGLAAAVPESPGPDGPVLAEARARGVLRVGVRTYPRPSPPGHPQPAEPDGFDADAARALAAQLGMPVELVGHGPADLQLSAHARAPGRAVVARTGGALDWAGLHGAAICVGIGSPYAHDLATRGATVRPYPSAVHAAYGFMAGECAAFVDDEALVERLLAQAAWRFYAVVPGTVDAATETPVALPVADAPSSHRVEQALRQWRANGGEARARRERTGNLSLEVALLAEGNICH